MTTLRSLYHRWLLKRWAVDEELWSATLARIPCAQALSPSERHRLRELTTLFLRDKSFDGAAGLDVTERMRTRIALTACVPIINLGLGYYEGWTDIVVYPGDFRVHEEYADEHGVVHRASRSLCGEALSQGPIILSWEAVENDPEMPGRDLVIHECAHKLDILNGTADGYPPLHREMSAKQWAGDWQAAYDRLCADLDAGRETAIDPYAATGPAEFFAVLSETFFVAPWTVYREFPAVYKQLTMFYRQDPYKRYERQLSR